MVTTSAFNVTDPSNAFVPPSRVVFHMDSIDSRSFCLAKEVLESVDEFDFIAFKPSIFPEYDVGLFSNHEIRVFRDGTTLLRSETPESGEYVETLLPSSVCGF